MATSNRAAIYNKIYRVLKKHYKPVPVELNRSVLQHLLYACCLENAHFENANEAYSKLMETYFDLNEVRVTSLAELGEVMKSLPEPSAGANRVKRVLQNVFESCYSFDIDSLRKQNIGRAVKTLEKYQATPFAISYVTQHALAGHSIPKDSGSLQALFIVGAITEAEAQKGQSPGLERTISKKKGTEFACLLHQLGADLFKSPHGSTVRATLLEIEPTAKDRFPKRKVKKKVSKPSPKGKAAKKTSPSKKAAKKTTTVKKSTVEKKAAAKKAKSKKRSPTKKKVGTRRISKRKPK